MRTLVVVLKFEGGILHGTFKTAQIGRAQLGIETEESQTEKDDAKKMQWMEARFSPQKS